MYHQLWHNLCQPNQVRLERMLGVPNKHMDPVIIGENGQHDHTMNNLI
ncbi:hypothetical protein BDK61_3146 [Haloarcula quadrata]|uniref:Uncharacterized protein n=1 Tax=Haloarcula quadrata TaxID=182779 RepID=A0A495R8Z8_9EURY|nr:hypothetical protein BDK61_3146 [Haloarcula quadrata]